METSPKTECLVFLKPFNLVLVALFSAACVAGPLSTSLSSGESVSPDQSTVEPMLEGAPASLEAQCIIEKNECIANELHNDFPGMVCANDGTPLESYCMVQEGGGMLCARSVQGGPCASQTAFVPEEFYRVEGASTYAAYGISGDVSDHTLVTPTGFSFAKASRSGSETLKFRTNIIEPSEIESENWFTAEIETIEFQTEKPIESNPTALSIAGRFDVQSIEPMDFKQIEKNDALPFWADQKAQIPVDYLEDPAATVWEWKGLRWFKLDTFQMLFQDDVLLFHADRNYTPGRIRFLMAFEVGEVPFYYIEQYIKARKEYFVLTQHGGEWLAREVRCAQCSP
jgi:hypothetical protein